MTTMSIMRHVLRNPLDFYYDIQEPDQIKWSHGVMLIILTYIVRMASLILISYHFETREAYQISFAHEFIWIIVPWMTWCVANWSVSTILEGEGKFKEIFVGSASALVPYIILTIPVTLLTNVFALSESVFYTTLTGFIFAWVGLLILIKVKVLHDFEVGKLIFITILTILAILIIWFLAIILYGLLVQFISFFFDIFKEIRFRL